MSTANNLSLHQGQCPTPDQVESDFDEPNAETLEAFAEAEWILAHPGRVKVYTSVEELAQEFAF